MTRWLAFAATLTWATAVLAQAAPKHRPFDLTASWEARRAACVRPAAMACQLATTAFVGAAVQAHGQGAWVYGEVLALEAHDLDPPLATSRARAAVTLAPSLMVSHGELMRAHARAHAWGPLIQAGLEATEALLRPGPQRAGLEARGTYALLVAAGAAALMLWLVGVVRHGPQAAHDLSHGLPPRLRGVVSPLCAALVLGLAATEPVSAMLLLTAILAAYTKPLERRGLAWVLGLWALVLGLVPHAAAPLAATASAPSARYHALHDATASWAVHRLPAAAAAHGKDSWALAHLARSRHDAEQALVLAERAISEGETDPSLLTLVGNLLWEANDYARAHTLFGQAAQRAPEDAVVQYNLATVLLSLARPVEADVARRKAFALGGPAFTVQAAAAQQAGRAVLEPPLSPTLWAAEVPHTGSAAAAAAIAAYHRLLLGPWPPGVVLGLLASGALALLGSLLAPRVREAREVRRVLTARCARCNALSCPRCTPAAADVNLCGPCHQALLGQGPEALLLRDRQEALSLAYFEHSLRLQQVVAWLLPGLGLLLKRRYGAGFFCAIGFGAALYLFAVATGWVLDPAPLWRAPEGCTAAWLARALPLTVALLMGLLGGLFGQAERA